MKKKKTMIKDITKVEINLQQCEIIKLVINCFYRELEETRELEKWLGKERDNL